MLKKDFTEAREDDIKKLAIEIEKSERSSPSRRIYPPILDR
jgi:hypothetical protein